MSQPTVFIPTRPTTPEVVDYVLNLDTKAIVYAGLVVIGHSTPCDLGQEIDQHCSTDKPARCRVRTYDETFTDAGFAIQGMAISKHSRLARHYEAIREEEVLPILKEGFEWTEEYKRSLSSVLSGTNSKGETRGPFNTIQLLDGLLKGIKVSEMEYPRGVAHNARLESLVADGLVLEEDPNKFFVLDPRYKGKWPFAQLRPESKALYQVLAIAKQVNPAESWTMPELTALAETCLLTDKGNIPKFRNVLTRAVSIYAPRYAPGAVTKIKLEPQSYKIAPHFIDAAYDLVERLTKIDLASEKTRTAGAKTAIEIYEDETKATDIYRRGADSSPDL